MTDADSVTELQSSSTSLSDWHCVPSSVPATLALREQHEHRHRRDVHLLVDQEPLAELAELELRLDGARDGEDVGHLAHLLDDGLDL